MTEETIGKSGVNEELGLYLHGQQSKFRGKRPVDIEQLVEADNIKILGQDGGILLIQMTLTINKEPFTFIGPMQVVKGDAKPKDNYGITYLNLLDTKDK